MNGPSKEELLEFMRKNYGDEWATEDKLPLARMLWEKKYGGKYTANVVEYEKAMMKDIERGRNYIVEGIVLNIEKTTYQGCPVCKRSVKRMCEHISSGKAKPVWLTRFIMLISDGTGELRVDGVFTDEVPDIQVGDLVEVKGYVSKTPNVLRMIYNDSNVLKRMNYDISSEQDKKKLVDSSDQKISKQVKKNVDVMDDFGWSKGNTVSDEPNGKDVQQGDVLTVPYNVFKILEFVKRIGAIAEQPLVRVVQRENVEFNDVMKYLVKLDDGKYKIGDDIDFDKIKVV